MYVLIGIALILMILAGIYFYYYINRTFLFWSKGRKNRWVSLILVLCSILFAMGCSNPFGMPALIGYHILGISLGFDAVNGVIHLIHRKSNREAPIWNRIYRCGLIPLAATAVVLFCGYFYMMDVKEKIYEVSTEKQLHEASGYKVAFLSDLHFGNTMDAEKLQQYCDKISAKEPDFVVLGGDIVDERTTKDEMEQALKVLGKIKSKYGIFYVYGNHDSASYSDSADFSITDLKRNLNENNIHCLADETYEINDDMLLVGRSDKGYGDMSDRTSIEELLSGQNQNRFILLIDHQPVDLQKNADAGVDLQLSGHTHGGQIWPVGLISDLLGFGEMNYGEKQIGEYKIIVSSGIAGWGYPIRTGHDSEYLMVEIK